MSTTATCRACSGPSHDGPDAACPRLAPTPSAASWPRWYELEERAAIMEHDGGKHRAVAEALAKAARPRS